MYFFCKEMTICFAGIVYIKGGTLRGSDKLLNKQVQCNPEIRGAA